MSSDLKAHWPGLEGKYAEELIALGQFTPTDNPQSREAKGALYDFDEGCSTKAYMTSEDMRKLAAALVAAAEWLDRRAESGGTNA